MIEIFAPYPGTQEIFFLPNPQWNDSQAPSVEIQSMEAMDGTKQTHAKTTGRRIFIFSFVLTRTKSINFLAFYNSFMHNQWRITDHKGNYILGYIKTNPLNMRADRRGTYDSDNDSVTVEFEFEGVMS